MTATEQQADAIRQSRMGDRDLIDSLYATINRQAEALLRMGPAPGRPPDLSRCWAPVCDVDVGALRFWVAGQLWPVVAAHKPQRLFDIPPDLLDPVTAAVLAHFGESALAHEPMLSRMPPGQVHGLHVDNRPDGVLTRVHVVLTTNPGAWMFFEEEGRRVHFEAGWAYAFDVTRRHAFGNDGDTDRVHLVFEVLGKEKS